MVLKKNLSAVFLAALCLAGCVKQAPPESLAASDPTDVTSIDGAGIDGGDAAVRADAGPDSRDASAPQSAVTGSSDAEFDEPFWEGLREAGQGTDGAQAPDLNLALPKGLESADHLFANSDKGPNYFKSSRESKEKESVKLKGKLYMIDEPTPEKRIQNVDGGEVGIVVPLN